MKTAVLDKLPPPVKMRLDALVESLREALGDDLAAVLVYGSAVRGGYVEGRSDVDVLVVLHRDDRSTLQKIDNALLLARTSARIESMLLVSKEIPRAADVFPLLYDDVRACHVVLHGDDPFSKLEIADDHRRLRIEQELREARIRSRLILAEAIRLPRQLRGAVARKVKQLRSPMAALLRLKGQPAKSDTIHDVFEAACSVFAVDKKTLLDFDEAPEKAYDALIELLDRAIDDVDTLDVEGSAA